MLATLRRLALTLLLFCVAAGTAAAQTNLRIGLAEDPDTLDPTPSRTYVGRIVFASMCDKLFDAAKFLAEGDMLYLYHPQVLIAHSDRLEGYKPMPDGLVRVVGLKLK